jgi:hypothetical protein
VEEQFGFRKNLTEKATYELRNEIIGALDKKITSRLDLL